LSNGWMVDNHPSFELMDNYISFNSNYNHRNGKLLICQWKENLLIIYCYRFMGL
jgi:hypothetical protein